MNDNWPTDEPVRRSSTSSSRDEPSVDVGGYMAAIGRNRRLIALIVGVGTAVVLALSLILPKNYTATAKISFDPGTVALGTQDATSTQRELATLNTLLTSSQVLDVAAKSIPDETGDSLTGKVSSSVNPDANIINVVGSDGHAAKAAHIANAVATGFLTVQAGQEKERLQRAQVDLQAQIDRLQNSGAPDTSAQVTAIQNRLSQIAVDIQVAGSELQIAQPADVPTSPSSPQPVRNTILALFGFFFIGVLIALGRDQLRPRLRSGREFSRLAGGLPILATIPDRGRRLLAARRNGVAEHEAYQTLRAAVRAAIPADRHEVVLVTSALHAEGKSTVTTRLGKALAQAGHRTLLVSADLRAPSLHWAFDVPLKPGLTEAIRSVEKGGGRREALAAVVRNVAPTDSKGAPLYPLDVIPSGEMPDDPSKLLSGRAAQSFFKYIHAADYEYVLIDSPPLLGLADTQALAEHVDEVLVVGRLDRLGADNVIDARDLLARLGVHRMGLVLIGGQVEASSYHYYARR
jgi:tyrosine-protein kinase